ncbi:MAG: S8 family serine peptidase, partial [Bryobacterales bacterium]|nr:S8 family serine peptidase [Bryobacteraceae bacterium]MDW8131849.1 S8 family serine peptidase [Bryobacterales bacterium]
NACNFSPARTGTLNGVMTVAAVDQSEREASWSNYGACVDIWAPGVSIPSTWLRGGTNTLSGTSMAAPHVAGTAGLLLSRMSSYLPDRVESDLKSTAVLTGTASKDGTPIRRVFAGAY